ncbi:hypothetical protein E3N88_06825 [Mikania micrantha]|uniref:Uncharacterized protein n=1 Tax=Mikania micrantha TaxID=192012 RepID=A0A5N6PSP6_9ASTR|nr:hypothetical protein E3N88_06825 [Mikania micrantha]
MACSQLELLVEAVTGDLHHHYSTVNVQVHREEGASSELSGRWRLLCVRGDSTELLDVRGILEEEICHGWLKVAGVVGVVGDGACNWSCCSLSACFLTMEQGETQSSVCWRCEKRVQETRRGGAGLLLCGGNSPEKRLAGGVVGAGAACFLLAPDRKNTHKV